MGLFLFMESSDVPFFRGLSKEEFASVRQCLREKSFEKGAALFMEGNSCEKIFFVKAGRVKLYRISSSGREQILETLGPGDTCACNPGSQGWSCASTAEAVTACTVWFLSRMDYVRIVQTSSTLARTLNRLFLGNKVYALLNLLSVNAWKHNIKILKNGWGTVDTGVRTTHEDIGLNLWTNPGAVVL